MAQMMFDAPPWAMDLEAGDFSGVERILAHCRAVVTETRARRLDNHLRRAQGADRTVRAFRGGAGLLDRVRIVLVADDSDTRDLIRMLLEWYGAEAATVTTSGATSFVATFRPDLILVDLPFAREQAFTLVGQIRKGRRRNGARPRLVALTKHGHDHTEHEAIAAGFDTQVAEPVDPEVFERALVALLR